MGFLHSGPMIRSTGFLLVSWDSFLFFPAVVNLVTPMYWHVSPSPPLSKKNPNNVRVLHTPKCSLLKYLEIIHLSLRWLQYVLIVL